MDAAMFSPTEALALSYEHLRAGRIAQAQAAAAAAPGGVPDVVAAALALADAAAALQQNELMVTYLQLADRSDPDQLDAALRLLAYWRELDPEQATAWLAGLWARQPQGVALEKICASLVAMGAEDVALAGTARHLERCVATHDVAGAAVAMMLSRYINGHRSVDRSAINRLSAAVAPRCGDPSVRWAAAALAFLGDHDHLPTAAEAAAAETRALAGLPPLAVEAAAAAVLAEAGRLHLGPLLTAAQSAEIVARSQAAPCRPSFFSFQNKQEMSLAEARRTSVYASYAPEFILSAPGVLEAANDPRVLGLVESYLGAPPILYSLNLWWTFDNPNPGVTHSWHRDIEDCKFISLFINMTDVDEESGPFVFIPGSHQRQALDRRLAAVGRGFDTAPFFRGDAYGADDRIATVFDGLAERWLSPAGSGTLCDNYGLHRGEPVRRGARLMLWIRYGYGANLGALSWVPTKAPFVEAARRLGDTLRTRWTNQLYYG